MLFYSKSCCNTVTKIIQVLLVLIIDVLQNIKDKEDITSLIIPPSIIAIVYAIFILIQTRYNYNLQILSLVCGLIILFSLKIIDKGGSKYTYSTSIIFCLFNDNTIMLHKEAFIFILILSILTKLYSLHDINWTIIILIIISFLIQIIYTIIIGLQAKEKRKNNFLTIQLDSSRQDEINQITEKLQIFILLIIQNSSWLSSFNAFLLDFDIQLLYCFQNQQKNILNKNIYMLDSLSQQFICNSRQMQLNQQNIKNRKVDEIIQYLTQAFDYDYHSYFQFVSKDHSSIINIIIVNKNNQIFYVVYFQSVPKLNDNLTSLLDVTSSISHELSSHLNSIITLSQLCSDNPNILDKNLKDNFIEPILANSQQLELIINNLKDYNIIQLNNFQSQIQKFNIVYEIFEICDYFKMIIQEKQLQINFKFNLDDHFLESDRLRFRQIFYQLIQNAIKFTFKNSIYIHVHNEQAHIKVQVIDQGQGMDENEQIQLLKIFQFQQLARVSERSVGCSLGLHISNLLAKKIGDNKSIHFESAIKKGSTFTFLIKNFQQQMNMKPYSTLKRISMEQYQDSQFENLIQVESLVNDYYSNSRLSMQQKKVVTKKNRSNEENISLNYSDEDIMQASKPPILQTKHLQQAYNLKINEIRIDDCCVKVLIVDDEYFNIFALQTFLKYQNQKSEYAFNGQEAIDKIYQKLDNPCRQCKSNSYKLVFLDIIMPIKDGIQTVREIKQIVSTKNIQKICCAANSAFSDIETKQRAYEAGMDFYLTKPLNLPILKQLINNVFIGQIS